jgi:hypothetical protein
MANPLKIPLGMLQVAFFTNRVVKAMEELTWVLFFPLMFFQLTVALDESNEHIVLNSENIFFWLQVATKECKY